MIAHQMLRHQPQPAPLPELRKLRADWVAVGPGAGLDPIIAMELEAAESGAERLALAEALRLIRNGQFIEANEKLEALGSPRYLPAAVVQALPELRAELKQVIPFHQIQQIFAKKAPGDGPTANYMFVLLKDVPENSAPAAYRALDVWSRIDFVRVLFEEQKSSDGGVRYSVKHMNEMLENAQAKIGPEITRKLRVELSACLFLCGRNEDAAKLLEGEIDPVHAAAVLADVRAVVLGRGELTVPQIAKFVPAEQPTPPPQAVSVLPPDQLAKWKPPARKPGETTVDAALADAKRHFKTANDAEMDARIPKVHAAADRIRAALVAEGQPLKPFLDKVEKALGRPFTPVERQLAVAAGTRGLTVAETVGVLSTEAHRPAAATKLVVAVPAFTNPAAFAVSVEVSGRTPAAFAPHPDAAFKLPAVHDRARIRDTFTAVLDIHAAKVAAGPEVPPLERAALEADVAKQLGLTAPDTLTPAESVQALLDVCRDWSDDHARLVAAWRELDEAIKDGESRLKAPLATTPGVTSGVTVGVTSGTTVVAPKPNAELQQALTSAKVRLKALALERQKREKGLIACCQLLGAYGKAALPAEEWLHAQTQGEDKPWRAVAVLNLARIQSDK